MPSFICCLHAAHVGNIQKAQPSAFRNSIKFLSLCSRLFLWNPIVMHWSWNQSPAVHAAISMISDSGVQKETRRERERIHNNAIDNPINKREGGDRKYPGPWSSTGWTGVAKLRPVGQVWTRDTRRVSGDKREERKGLKSQITIARCYQHCGQLQSAAPEILCVFRTVDSSGKQYLLQLIVEATKAFVCPLLTLTICHQLTLMASNKGSIFKMIIFQL